MPCYSPLKGYYSKKLNPTGKRSIVFDPRQGIDDKALDLPCGQCIGCRLERSRQWAIRCVHEASLYEKNSFITLTYSPEHLPKDGSLQLHHFQRFMKRLRKSEGPNIRFFHCGEYGEKYQRPHYHACLFNYDFNDKKLLRDQDNIKLYTSEKLAKLWPLGFSTIGDVTFESAAYVARYVTKKIIGPQAVHHYNNIDYKTGEIIQERKPEYVTMSRRPGIGRPWLDRYISDVYPDDFVILRGAKIKPPKFYDSVLQKRMPYEHDDIKERRNENARLKAFDNTPDRLAVKEFIKKTQITTLKRKYENET